MHSFFQPQEKHIPFLPAMLPQVPQKVCRSPATFYSTYINYHIELNPTDSGRQHKANGTPPAHMEFDVPNTGRQREPRQALGSKRPLMAHDPRKDDAREAMREESSLDGSDDDFEPAKNTKKPSRDFAEIPVANESHSDDGPRTQPKGNGRQGASQDDPDTEDASPPSRLKGKGRQGPLQDDLDTDENVPMPGRGRLTKADVASFHIFGQATREAAQELADLHRVNLATVMCHAGLGAGKSTRTAIDFNTFKNIHASMLLSDTGGK